MNAFMSGIVWCAAALFVTGSMADQAEARTLRINESLGPGSIEEAALLEFKAIVEERTGGEIEISIHLQDELGNPQTSLENLQTGTLDLYSGALSYYAALAPEELGVTALLYLFKDNDHLSRYLQSPVFQAAHERLQEMGIRFVSTAFNGDRGPFRVFVSTVPIFTPEDLEGVRMRLWPSDIAIRGWSYLGAEPSVIAWTETYLSIRQGVVQAVTSGVTSIRSMNFTEVAPYVTELKQFPQTWPIAISEQVWQSLSAEEQQIMVDAANEASAFYAEKVAASAADDIDFMIREHGAAYIRVDTDLFAERMQPFYEELIEEGVLRQDVYDQVMSLR